MISMSYGYGSLLIDADGPVNLSLSELRINWLTSYLISGFRC